MKWGRTFKLLGALDAKLNVADLIDTTNQLGSMAHCNGEIGTVSCCLSSELVYLTAARGKSDYSASYYGAELEGLLG